MNPHTNKTAECIIGPIAFILFVIGIFYGIYYLDNMNKEHLKKIDTARTELYSLISNPKKLDAYADNPTPDPWGKPYVAYEVKGIREGLLLISAGPDGEYGTQDDIKVKDTHFNWREIGRATGKNTGSFARGFIKGIKESDDK